MVRKLRARMETLRVGDPLDKAIDIGAIIAPVQLAKIQQLVEQGVDEGAQCWQPSWACPSEGCFYPPTLFTEVSPSSTIAQVEIFGPVLVTMTFRTPAEAVELANNTRFGLAASVWSESINLALDVAPKIKAGVVWVNCTNLFDAAAGFGGYRESGFGREGGREGLYEYLKPGVREGAARPTATATSRWPRRLPRVAARRRRACRAIDRTPKLYIGGKQARPDAGYSRRSGAPTGGWSARSARATARTSATRWRRRARRRAGPRRRRTTGRRSSTTSPRTWRRGPTSSRSGSRP